MKTESTVRPELVERYPSLVRINWDVSERRSAVTDKEEETVTMYDYRMLELPGINTGLDELSKLLVTDKYPLEEQVRVLSAGTSQEVAAFRLFTNVCHQVAHQVLGLPVTVDVVRDVALARLAVYDCSDAVNSFVITKNGIKVTDYWISRDLRTSLEGDVTAAASVGDTYKFDIRELGITLELNCRKFLEALSMLRRYAYTAYNVTSTHEAAINALTNVEDVEGYDFTHGYPEKLIFEITDLM